jgi:pimeloyl-ACP methyl ester carboxylesterase
MTVKAHQSETFEVSSRDGTPLGVRRSGEGPPVVLVHGTAAGRDSFVLLEPSLAETRTVWSYDRRGRGASGDQDHYAFHLEAEDFLAVFDAATNSGNVQADVVTHSFGGCCVLHVAQPRAVRSLAIYEPPLFSARLDASEKARLRSLLDAQEWDGALELFLRLYGGSSDEEVQFLRSLPEVWSRLEDATHVLRREIDPLNGDYASWMKAPTVPMLAFYGEDTTCLNFPTVEELQKLFPTAQICPIEGQRHLGLVFAPGVISAALNAFWRSL